MDHEHPRPPGDVPGGFPEEDSSRPWIDKMEDKTKKTPSPSDEVNEQQQRFLEAEEQDVNKDDTNVIMSSSIPRTLLHHEEDGAAAFSQQSKENSNSKRDLVCSLWSKELGKNNENIDIAEDGEGEKADFSRLILLLARFETLGIKAKPKMYTKLSDKEKRQFSSFFQHIREHEVLSHKVDLSQFHERPQTKNLENSLKEEEEVIYCKNLFLKDRKGQFFFVITKEDFPVDLKQLKNQLNASRNLSFADENALSDILGLKLGELTPLALMQQSAQNVRVIFHESLSFVRERNAPPMAFHSFSALLQVEILFSELELFISHCGKLLEILKPKEDLLTGPQMKPDCTGTDTDSLLKIPQGKTDKGKGKEKAEKNKKNSPSLNNKKKEKKEGGVTTKKLPEMPTTERADMSAMIENISSSSRRSDSSKNFAKNMNLDLEKDNGSSCSTHEGISRCGEKDEEIYVRENLKTEEIVSETESKSKREPFLNAQDSCSKLSAFNSNLNIVEASSKAEETPRHVKQKMKMITNGARKGKLKSYVRKKARLLLERGDAHQQQTTTPVPLKKSSNSNVFGKENEDRNNESCTTVDAEKIQTEGITSCYDDSSIFSDNDKGTLKKDEYKKGIDSLFRLSPKTTLPEIDEFYNFLHNFEIPYRELDMESSTTKDIGPALGVRCFLFKDGKGNYFFIISHEFYEPDYGRLKKALRPKKYLDPCQMYELMDVLGVDSLHFTPFAVMNHRCRRNKVQVFFTEKITPPQVVLCIQHPFAQGRRLILSSSDLQCLVAHFSSSNTNSNSIGVVEEKAWPSKYNSIFSRFDARDDSNSNPLKKILNHHKTKEGRKDNPPNYNKPKFAGGGGGGVGVFKKVTEYLKETSQNFFCNNHMFRKVSNIFSNINYYHDECASTDIYSYNSRTLIGSPVDGKFENNNSGIEVFELGGSAGTTEVHVKYDDDAMILSSSSEENDGNISRKTKNSSGKDHHDAILLFAVDGEEEGHSLLHEVEETGEDENRIVDTTINNYSPVGITISDDDDDKVERVWNQNQYEDEESHEDLLLDSNFENYNSNSTNSSLPPSTSIPPMPMYRPDIKDAKVLVETIKRHLDEHLIDYRSLLIESCCHSSNSNSNCNLTTGHGRGKERREFDNAGSTSNDNVSQICHTQHFWAEATNTHYIVVGRDIEHILPRRFVRRFQIPNRVLLIDDGNDNRNICSCDCNTDTKKATFTNPFSIFLFTHHSRGKEMSGGDHHPSASLEPEPSFKLVLHTSIYMDPEMECVFDFTHAAGVSLCMSSRDLEHYAQKVGMDVLYMP